jgi:hypothetical protein
MMNERVILGIFQRKLWEAEAWARRAEALEARRVVKKTKGGEEEGKKEERLAEAERRLEREKGELEKSLVEEKNRAKLRKAELQRQIERLRGQIEAVKGKCIENRGFIACLRY